MGGAKRKGAPSSKTTRKPKTRKKMKLSPHINPWTISSGQLRRQSAQTTLVEASSPRTPPVQKRGPTMHSKPP
jgi:hypothetical protein